jgi:hypothetical protein
MVKPYVEVNGIRLLEFDSYHPQQFDITKGGRNALTGHNRLRLVAKKWKLVIGAAFISNEEYKKITDEIDKNTLSLTVKFQDKNDEMVEMNAYAVYNKEMKIGDDIMGGWSNFSLELIEN